MIDSSQLITTARFLSILHHRFGVLVIHSIESGYISSVTKCKGAAALNFVEPVALVR